MEKTTETTTKAAELSAEIKQTASHMYSLVCENKTIALTYSDVDLETLKELAEIYGTTLYEPSEILPKYWIQIKPITGVTIDIESRVYKSESTFK